MKLNSNSVLQGLLIFVIIFCQISNVSFAQQANNTPTEKLLKLTENLKISDYDELEKLIKLGAQLNSINSNGVVPLNTAFQLLNEVHTDSIKYNTWIMRSHIDGIETMLRNYNEDSGYKLNGKNVNKIDLKKALEDANAPIIAPSIGRKIIELMMQNGADIDFINEGGLTILQSAVVNKDPELCRLLMPYNPNVNLLINNGTSMLQMAINSNDYILCNLLLTNGADIGIVNDKIQTAFVSKELKSVLKKHGATFKMKKAK